MNTIDMSEYHDKDFPINPMGRHIVLIVGYIGEEERKALEEIAGSDFQKYGHAGHGVYGIGVSDGHRYCAEIASRALNVKTPKPDKKRRSLKRQNEE